MKKIFRANRIVLLLAVTAGLWFVFGSNRLPSADARSGRPAAGASKASTKQAPLSGSMLMSPQAVAKMLPTAKGKKVVVIQVGFYNLYAQAHIPGAEYLGPASKPDGLAKLRKGVQSLRRDQSILLYCGCCPWSRCPNIKPAYEALRAMGFTHVRVMHIANNFGTDWVTKGYPTTRD